MILNVFICWHYEFQARYSINHYLIGTITKGVKIALRRSKILSWENRFICQSDKLENMINCVLRHNECVWSMCVRHCQFTEQCSLNLMHENKWKYQRIKNVLLYVGTILVFYLYLQNFNWTTLLQNTNRFFKLINSNFMQRINLGYIQHRTLVYLGCKQFA